MNKLVLIFFLIGIISCQKDPQEVNDEELITTLIYKLKSTSGNDEVVMTFSDPDGNGGNAPIITTSGFLQAGKMYIGSLTLLNESLNPIKDLTLEIKDEGLDHQFFFTVSNELSGKLSIKYADADTGNNPIGLQTQVSSTLVGTGQINIVLRHEPNKKAQGVSDGLITNAGGDTDIDVSFGIEVK